MSLLEALKDIDAAIGSFVREHGAWTYLLVFLVGLTQTGFVLGPALPGTTIIFICGVIARTQPNAVNIVLVMAVGAAGAWLGCFVHYGLGKWAGSRLFVKEKGLFSKDKLAKAEEFFEKHGRLAMVIAPSTPIMRTFVPVAAGGAHMALGHYALFALAGVMLWTGSAGTVGYLFGMVPGAKTGIMVAAAVFSVFLIGRMAWQARQQPKPEPAGQP